MDPTSTQASKSSRKKDCILLILIIFGRPSVEQKKLVSAKTSPTAALRLFLCERFESWLSEDRMWCLLIWTRSSEATEDVPCSLVVRGKMNGLFYVLLVAPSFLCSCSHSLARTSLSITALIFLALSLSPCIILLSALLLKVVFSLCAQIHGGATFWDLQSSLFNSWGGKMQNLF